MNKTVIMFVAAPIEPIAENGVFDLIEQRYDQCAANYARAPEAFGAIKLKPEPRRPMLELD